MSKKNRNKNKNQDESKDDKKEAHEIPLQDKIYAYDDKRIEQLNKERPWKKDPKYFKKCRINVLAATKMVKHAIQGVNQGRKTGGLPTEIMGLLVGRPDPATNTLVIMDCIELPVEGSETRVVADDEKVLGFMTRMQDRIEELRKDRFIGWYHSHPFEVGAHSNAFFSATDVNTQLLWQMQFGKWVGIVVDPLRCLAKQKVELLAFMAYPPNYDPPKGQGPDGVMNDSKDALAKRWGAAYNRYYNLKHSFFMGSLVRHNLEMMSRKHLWIRQLSSSAILEPENRDELPKRIQSMTKKTNLDPMHRKGNNNNDPMKESMAMGKDLAVEQCIGHSMQLIKNAAFNSTILNRSVHNVASPSSKAFNLSKTCQRRTLTTTSAVEEAKAVTDQPLWQGAKLKPLALCIGAGFILRFLVPIPAGVTPQGWSLMSIFLCTIAGLVLEPLPTGATAFLGLTAAVLTKTLTFAQATAAMNSEVIWLIVVSFFFAKGFEITGLGERVALLFVKIAGKSSLGLSYGLNAAEAIVTPAMPSTTARAAGIFVPVMRSIAESSGSHPDGPSRRKLGAFLAHSQFQTSSHTSALFLTGAAQNLLCLKLVTDVIGPIPNPFVTWIIGAFVPAMAGLILTPILIYAIQKPEIRDTPDAPAEARRELDAKGPMSTGEKVTAGTMLLAVALWMAGESIGVSAVLTAMIALCILLVTGTLKWKDCLEYPPAWDTLFWFAVLISMSGALNSMGVIKALSDNVAGVLMKGNLGWMPIFFILQFVYFFVHYLFASQTAHVGALLVAFLTLMISANVPPLLAGMTLAFNSNLFGSITQFASGQAAVYYGSGYMTLPEMFSVGAIVGLFNVILWGVVGIVWWKIIGWW